MVSELVHAPMLWNLLSQECKGHGRFVLRKKWWMQSQVSVGEDAIEENCQHKSMVLILYLLPMSVSPRKAASVVL